MGFLDDVRQQQANQDAKINSCKSQLQRDAKTMFTSAILAQHAKAIADGMKQSLKEKIVARDFTFDHSFFGGKKRCRYQDNYCADIELHPNRYDFPPSYCVLTNRLDGRDSNARPSFPSQDFMYIFNSSNYDGRDEDRIHCWSTEHVIKSFERAIKLLRADGIDARLNIANGANGNPIEIALHAEVPCDSNGNV